MFAINIFLTTTKSYFTVFINDTHELGDSFYRNIASLIHSSFCFIDDDIYYINRPKLRDHYVTKYIGYGIVGFHNIKD